MEVLLLQLGTCCRRQQRQQIQPPPLQQPQTPPQQPQRQCRRKERIVRQRITILGMREQDLVWVYRLNRESIVCLLHLIAPHITARLQTPHNIPPITEFLVVLHMMVSGSFQTTGALVAGISQSSFSVCLPKVLDAILHLTSQHICFSNTQQLQYGTKQGFYQIAGFSHVLGAMNCTEVQLVSPAAAEHLYRNRKHTHSINVQAIIDHRELFTNILGKYPDSIHDAYIFCHCTINQRFQDGEYSNGLLIANQGYGIQPWVMTPFAYPTSVEQWVYNERHRKTHNLVERTSGILKSRFRCLALTEGSLLYAQPLVCKIILACAILHNLCVRTNITWDEKDDVRSKDEDDDGADHVEGEQINTAAGVRRRCHIVDNFYT
ncbi:putative nuclease HARBI1 [Pleurodeles waltl]|uniref:putative nuclease HARBI1 n=1 Tax=Pleurodeles waltl TaxID=8319 RepID=UPI0037096EF5